MTKSLYSLVLLMLNLFLFFGISLFTNHQLLFDFKVWVVVLQIVTFLISQPPINFRDLLNPKDRFSMLLILVAVLIVINASILNYATTSDTNATSIYYELVGFLMIVGGGFYRIYAIRILEKYFSNITEIRPSHQICMSGPYARVRHPSYTGAIVSLTGTIIWLGVYSSIWWEFIIIISVYAYRIIHEEKMLINHFGKTYEEYRKKTRALM